VFALSGLGGETTCWGWKGGDGIKKLKKHWSSWYLAQGWVCSSFYFFTYSTLQSNFWLHFYCFPLFKWCTGTMLNIFVLLNKKTYFECIKNTTECSVWGLVVKHWTPRRWFCVCRCFASDLFWSNIMIEKGWISTFQGHQRFSAHTVGFCGRTTFKGNSVTVVIWIFLDDKVSSVFLQGRWEKWEYLRQSN